MAEIRKRENVKEYKIDKKGNEKSKAKEVKLTDSKNKSTTDKTKVKQSKEKKNLWVKFRVFCHGVKSETQKVHWPSKKDMFKYSVATIIFIVFCSLFFYLIEVIFALIQTIFN